MLITLTREITQPPLYAGEIMFTEKLCLLRPTVVDINPSRKRELYENAPQTEEIWNRRLFVFV